MGADTRHGRLLHSDPTRRRIMNWPRFNFWSRSNSRKHVRRHSKGRSGRRPPLGLQLLEERLVPTLLVVNSLNDAAVNLADTVVTLRDALDAANNDSQVSPGGP